MMITLRYDGTWTANCYPGRGTTLNVRHALGDDADPHDDGKPGYSDVVTIEPAEPIRWVLACCDEMSTQLVKAKP